MEAAKKTKFGTTVAYARTSNTRIAQRKRAIPHSTLKYDVPYTQRRQTDKDMTDGT